MPTQSREFAMRYIDAMLERVESCKYPSGEMLDRIERAVILFWDEERDDARR